MHISDCLTDIILPTIFVHKHFSQNKVFQVCLCLVLLLLFCCFSKGSITASSNFTTLRMLILFRVTISHVGFFLPVGFFQHFDYFPLQSLKWYLVARGVQFQISWTQNTEPKQNNFSFIVPKPVCVRISNNKL